MAHQSEHIDFSGLFKLDVLVHLDIAAYSFYEVGLKKFLAFSSDKELIFFYINPQSERFEKNYDWDFVDNPVHCMCFEPSGTWLLILSDQKVLLVPFLPLFIPQNTFDHKWSLSSVTVLPIANIQKPTSVVWWLTKESENILIIGSKTGTITFYSLESQTIVGECKVSGEIIDLQMCFDDSLDLLALLISRNKSQQWKLVLEHRSYGYNWLQQMRSQTDKEKKDGFMSYIKQLSKDKITLFTQGGSKDDNKTQSIEYVLKPVEYLPLFRKGSNNWALSAQYVNGRHFLTAFELNEGSLILESPEEETPSRTLRPKIKKDGLYIQGLWSQRLIYLLRKNELEVHSGSFSVIQGDGLLGAKREFSELWSAELIGDVKRGHLMSTKEPGSAVGGWREPTFLCDLQLPRFSIEPCLVVTTCGAYILNTVCEPCEWLVGLVMRGGVGAEQSAAALGAPVATLLRAAADMLLARGKVAPAQYLYSLAQSPPDGWVARLGVFGRLHELSMYKYIGSVGGLGDAAITIKLLAMLLKMGTNNEVDFEPNVKFTTLSTVQLSELSSMAAAIGLWALVPVFSVHRGHPGLLLAAIKARGDICRGAVDCLLNVKFTTLSTVQLSELSSMSAAIGLWALVPVFSVHRGHPSLLLAAIKARGDICRGAVDCLLNQRCLVPLMLEENTQWLFDFIIQKCNKFDTKILKRFCLWLNPLQDQLRPVIRDMSQGITSIYTTRMLYLIETFMHVASAIEARQPCPEIHLELTQNPETWKNQFIPRRRISCGLAHWAVADEGNAKVLMTNTQVNTELIGRVLDVACGRHHTLILTENGVYASGENSFGQLGVGAAWAGAVGDAARPAGALLHVRGGPGGWGAPLVGVAAGHYHSAAIDAGGRLFTWGYILPGGWGAPLVGVAAGHYHSAAIDAGGRLFTWGWGVHGQLGLGTIEDEWSPKLVTKFQGRKVLSVGLGACHTVCLMRNGEVWACGAGVFGQLGAGARAKSAVPARVQIPDPALQLAVGYFHSVSLGACHTVCLMRNGELWACGAGVFGQLGAGARAKSAVPARVQIPDPALQLAVGYFHSLALTNKGQLYVWGASPQQVRAAHARRTASPSVVHDPLVDPHLMPSLVDTQLVTGHIVQLSAGWHHSCVINNYGTLYSWGLNFDGQLGSGDRKQVHIPTEVKIRNDAQPEKVLSPKTPDDENKDFETKALVACGGDFTIYVDDDGRIYATGNTHLQIPNDKDKMTNRVIMMKTTKRVIKIPANRNNNKFLFQPIDRIDIMFPFDLEVSRRKPIESRQNPLSSMSDFKRKTWADDVILLLKPWINSDNLSGNLNMAAKLAYHNKKYSDCLSMLLDNLNSMPQDDRLYLTHTELDENTLNTDAVNSSRKQDEIKIIITNVMSKRIKDVSLAILNEEAYPEIDPAVYQALSCCCDELKSLPGAVATTSITNISEQNLSIRAANIIDKCMSIFPVDTKLWETCFRQSKNFFIDNNLSIPDLETVLRKYMETNATTMAAAIMYSNDCDQYSEILTPKFYLNMCSQVLDTWG